MVERKWHALTSSVSWMEIQAARYCTPSKDESFQCSTVSYDGSYDLFINAMSRGGEVSLYS